MTRRGNYGGKVGGYSVAIVGGDYQPEEDEELVPGGGSAPAKIKVELENPLTGDVWVGWVEWDGIDWDTKERARKERGHQGAPEKRHAVDNIAWSTFSS